MSLNHWFMAVGLDSPQRTTNPRTQRDSFEKGLNVQFQDSFSPPKKRKLLVQHHEWMNRILGVQDQSPVASCPNKKKRKSPTKAEDAIVEKADVLEGATASFFGLTKMMTGKTFGAHRYGQNFRAQFQLTSSNIRLVKTFTLERDAIAQHHTWVNQLTMDDGNKGVTRRFKRWWVTRYIEEKQILLRSIPERKPLPFERHG